MKKTSPINVRLDPAELEKVATLAERYNVNQATVIRWSISALAAYVERHHGHLHLPVDLGIEWEAIRREPATQDPPPASLRAAEDTPRYRQPNTL